MTPLFAESLGLTGATYTGTGWEPKLNGDTLGQLLDATAECTQDCCLRAEINAMRHSGELPQSEQATGRKSERLLALGRELAQHGFRRVEVHVFNRHESCGYAVVNGVVYTIPYCAHNHAPSPSDEHVVWHDPDWDDDGQD